MAGPGLAISRGGAEADRLLKIVAPAPDCHKSAVAISNGIERCITLVHLSPVNAATRNDTASLRAVGPNGHKLALSIDNVLERPRRKGAHPIDAIGGAENAASWLQVFVSPNRDNDVTVGSHAV